MAQLRNVKIKPIISTEFLTGGTVATQAFVIEGAVGNDASINGEYIYLGLRNWTSRYTTTPTTSPTYPIWSNGVHAIFFCGPLEDSGYDVTSGGYAFGISPAGSVYNQMVDFSDTYISVASRYAYGLNKVVYSGSGVDFKIESADIMDISSGYGSYSSQNVQTPATAGLVFGSKGSSYVVEILNAIELKYPEAQALQITGTLAESLDKQGVMDVILPHIVSEVNSHGDVNQGVFWSLAPNNHISTNQPYEHQFGLQLNIDRTNGGGDVGYYINGVFTTFETHLESVDVADIQTILDKVSAEADRVIFSNVTPST